MTDKQVALVREALNMLQEAYGDEAPLNTGDLYRIIEIAVNKLESALENEPS